METHFLHFYLHVGHDPGHLGVIEIRAELLQAYLLQWRQKLHNVREDIGFDDSVDQAGVTARARQGDLLGEEQGLTQLRWR